MLGKQPEERPQSARWVADRARQLRGELERRRRTWPSMWWRGLPPWTRWMGGSPAALTDPALGASVTRADLGVAAAAGTGLAGGPPGTGPGPGPRPGTGDRKNRRRSAFLAAAVSVAIAAVGGTVAAFMLSGHPMNTASDNAPVSPAATSPARPAGPHPRP